MKTKSERIMEWLFGCPYIRDLYFNFSESSKGDTVLIPNTAYNDEWADGMPYIDGTGVKICTFTLVRFERYSVEPNSSENAEVLFDVEEIAHWFDEQSEIGNFPSFPEDCDIMEMEVLPFQNGGLAGQDENEAKYMFSIQIKYFYNKEKI